MKDVLGREPSGRGLASISAACLMDAAGTPVSRAAVSSSAHL